MKFLISGNAFLIGLCALFWVGCDSAPGVQDMNQVAPVIHPGEVLVSPEIIDTDGLVFSDGKATAEITVTINASDADNNLSKAFVVVQSPVVGAEPAGEVEVNIPGNGLLAIKVPVSISQGASGVYQVVIFASDREERISNRVFGSVQITAGSEPPVIDLIEIPTTVTRPAAGQPALSVPIIAHVSDPDGLDNILNVEVVVNSAVTLKMCDDGGQGTCNAGFGSSGDAVAGDGKFTLTIQLTSANSAGQNLFEFTAIDRSGLRSSQVAKIIVVN